MALENLTQDEEFVRDLVKRVGKPVGEHDFHIMIKLAQDTSGKKSYNFELNYWEDINKDYKAGTGAVPISPALHEQVDSLVRKGYLGRNPYKPIIIYAKV